MPLLDETPDRGARRWVGQAAKSEVAGQVGKMQALAYMRYFITHFRGVADEHAVLLDQIVERDTMWPPLLQDKSTTLILFLELSSLCCCHLHFFPYYYSLYTSLFLHNFETSHVWEIAYTIIQAIFICL